MNSTQTKPDNGELQDKVDGLAWYHSVDFGNGIVSNGRKDHKTCVAEVDVVFKHDISGKSVLDIGAWSGLFSFEASKRGASRVLSTDSFAWQKLGGKPGYDFAKKIIAPDVEELEVDIMDISADDIGHFEVVLFLGVLYHMRHPLLALDKVSSVCSEHLIIETHMGCNHLSYPAAEFYPKDELGDDPSNWWGFNRPAIVGMLEDVGFSKVEFVQHPISPWSETRGFFHAFR